jgi:hypothetical protein
MNPYPFSRLNHFTVPMFMICPSDKNGYANNPRTTKTACATNSSRKRATCFAADMGTGLTAEAYEAIKATFRRAPMRSRHTKSHQATSLFLSMSCLMRQRATESRFARNTLRWTASGTSRGGSSWCDLPSLTLRGAQRAIHAVDGLT